jgi:uncharacterized protein (DUF4415 family)
MSRGSTSSSSRTDWDRVRSMKDEDIDFSDIPEIEVEDMREAVLRVGGKPVPEGKSFVGVLLDTEVLDYFRRKSGDKDLQRAINDTLRASMSKA